MTRATVTIKQTTTSNIHSHAHKPKTKCKYFQWNCKGKVTGNRVDMHTYFSAVASHLKANKNFTRKMGSAESLTASVQKDLNSNEFFLIRYCWWPFVFNQNSIMSRCAWKYFRLFPLFARPLECETSNESEAKQCKAKLTVLMIQPDVRNFFCLMSFRFHFSCIVRKVRRSFKLSKYKMERKREK